jgi:hypothetical protein
MCEARDGTGGMNSLREGERGVQKRHCLGLLGEREDRDTVRREARHDKR